MGTSKPIANVLRHYFPDWEPPEDHKQWNQCLCPAHSEDRPSCAVNYQAGAVKCLACGFSGDVISIIRQQEGVSYSQAIARAEEFSSGSDTAVSRNASRKSSRKVFGQARADSPEHSEGRRKLPAWLLR